MFPGFISKVYAPNPQDIRAVLEEILIKLQSQLEANAPAENEEASELSDEFKELLKYTHGLQIGLSEYDDAELANLFIETDGVNELISAVCEKGIIRTYQLILSENRRSQLSDEVNTFCEEAQAKTIVTLNGNRFPRLSADDRLADSSELLMGIFDLSSPLVLPRSISSAEIKLNAFQRELTNPDNKEIGKLLMRVPSDYIRLILYYGKITSFNDFRIFITSAKESYFGKKDYDKELYHLDIIETIAKLHPANIEPLLTKADPKSPKELAEVLFDSGRLRYLTEIEPSFHKLLCEDIHYTCKEDFLDSLSLTGKIIRDTIGYSYETSSSVKFTILKNIASVARFLEINSFEDLSNLLRSDDFGIAVRGIPNKNLEVVLDLSQPRNIRELQDLLEDKKLREAVAETKLSPLRELSSKLIDSIDERRRIVIKVLATNYNREIEEAIESLNEKIHIHISEGKLKDREEKDFSALLCSILDDPNHIEQNINTLVFLINDQPLTCTQIKRLNELKEKSQGFITPILASRYMTLENEDARDSLFQDYRKRMKEALGVKPIDISEPDLVAEIIYLAYRPKGYSVQEIEANIRRGEVEDFSEHLAGLNLHQEGYGFEFRQIESDKKASFDVAALRGVEVRVFRKPSDKIEFILEGVLSDKKTFIGFDRKLLAKVIGYLNDYRVNDYLDEYKEGMSYSDTFSQDRIERLSEIIRIIPKEGEFLEALREILFENETSTLSAIKNLERFLWLSRKGKFNSNDRKQLTSIEKLLGKLENWPDEDDVLTLAVEDFELTQHLGIDTSNLKASDLQKRLREEKWVKFFGSEFSLEEVLQSYLKKLQKIAKDELKIVTTELSKVEAKKTEQFTSGKAYASKNVGSYYAKAGAELCTGRNLGIWREKRHVHLNFEINDQIVGNVMLYFEPERDYLVVRGFNPRNDTLLSYDRRSIAQEMVRIVNQIAYDNGYSEVFITEQGRFIALSNRSGIAKEVLDIANKNQKTALRDEPKQRVLIENANFHVTELDSNMVYDRLILLCVTNNLKS